MFRIALITIGDEILIGQTVDSNAAWIAWQFTGLGAEVYRHTAIADSRDELFEALDRRIPEADLVVLTGGLGPTEDDITKDVLTEYFDDKLEMNKEILNYLKEFFDKRGFEFTERIQRQALLPTKCKPLANHVGTAPGMLFDIGGKRVISLPGVPAEMKYIMQNSAIPYVDQLITEGNHKVSLYRTLQTTGIPESKIADLVGDPSEIPGDVRLAYLPSYRGVKIRIGVKDDTKDNAGKRLDRAEKYLYEKAGKYIYTKGGTDLTDAVGKLLIEQDKTLAVAESCTAGMLGAAITETPGSSGYFTGGAITYSNEAKMHIMGVQEHTLIDYGAVSEQTAMEMAEGIRKRFFTDFGIGITGIAGPGGGTEEKPVGTVWIGLSREGKTFAKKYNFGNDRAVNRERSVGMALTMLLNELRG
ncbi:MAG: competence/damage-inducible protein A [Candidatus Kapaibacterium sp.]